MIRKTADKVHRHVCGHASFSDTKSLLSRDVVQDQRVERFLTALFDMCQSCRSIALPKASRKVSLSSISREFNEVVCVDHFYLNDLYLFPAIDSVTTYSAFLFVSDTSLDHAVFAIEACWLSQYWPPTAVLGDDAANH